MGAHGRPRQEVGVKEWGGMWACRSPPTPTASPSDCSHFFTLGREVVGERGVRYCGVRTGVRMLAGGGRAGAEEVCRSGEGGVQGGGGVWERAVVEVRANEGRAGVGRA